MLCLFLSIATVNAQPIHDMQDDIPTDKALHFACWIYYFGPVAHDAGCSAFEAFLITSAIAWGKTRNILMII